MNAGSTKFSTQRKLDFAADGLNCHRPEFRYERRMLSDKLKELQATRAKLVELEEVVASERTKELTALPGQYGFETVGAFIAAVRAAVGKRRGRKPGPVTVTKTPSGKRRKRAKVTDETRAEVKKLVGQEKTGREIAQALGISLPTVQNIKKALGLVRKK